MSGHYINFFNVIFSIIFFVHFLSISYDTIHPSLPVIEVYKAKLSDIEFPLVFKLCLANIDDPTERYEAVGYSDVDTFFTGTNKYNETLHGWGGFEENSTESIASVEG